MLGGNKVGKKGLTCKCISDVGLATGLCTRSIKATNTQHGDAKKHCDIVVQPVQAAVHVCLTCILLASAKAAAVCTSARYNGLCLMNS